jgi:hypothetical protein
VKRAFSLVEVLIAGLLVLAIGGAVVGLFTSAAQVGGQGADRALASLTAARLMDHLLAGGHRGLWRMITSGQDSGPLDLKSLDGGDALFDPTASYRLAEPAAGLIRVQIDLAWTTGSLRGAQTVVRYVADPLCGPDVNAPHGGLP